MIFYGTNLNYYKVFSFFHFRSQATRSQGKSIIIITSDFNSSLYADGMFRVGTVRLGDHLFVHNPRNNISRKMNE